MLHVPGEKLDSLLSRTQASCNLDKRFTNRAASPAPSLTVFYVLRETFCCHQMEAES